MIRTKRRTPANRVTQIICVCLSLMATPSWADTFETKGSEALMIDADTGTILLSKNPDQTFQPASLTKLMTMELVFHLLEAGRLNPDDMFTVSENAWRTGGAPSGTSTMFAKLGSGVSLRDLIQGAVVQQANDACIIMAEGVAGDETKFAAMMNARASEIGLTDSTFTNSTGLPAAGQQVSARDLVKLAVHMFRAYPKYYGLYRQSDFTWNKITQRNRNPLLAMNIGADGMATGFAEASGYAIVGMAERDGRRTVLALAGLPSDSARAQEARRLLDWSQTAFRKGDLFAAGAVIGQARIFGGSQPQVDLEAQGPVSVFLPMKETHPVTARIVYDGPLPAPIEKGAEVAQLQLWLGGTMSRAIPLYAAETVDVGTLHQRAMDGVTELFTGWMRKAPAS